VIFSLLVGLRRPIMRAVEAVVLIAAIPVFAIVAPLAALIITVGIMAVVAVIESRMHRRLDAQLGLSAPASQDPAP
jgi:hypothetical protein